MDRPIIKTEEQINGIRKSCQLAAKSLTFITPHVKAGITTEQLDQLLEMFIRDHKAIPACLGYKGFPKSTCISVNEVICHGIPGKYALKEGDIVNIDVTTILDGYFGDTSRMYSIPPISKEANDIMRVAKEALDVGIKQVRHGAYIGAIGREIQKFVERNNFSVVRNYTGHATGCHFHEQPQIPHFCPVDMRPIMQAGWILTVEPMINSGRHECIVESDGWTAKTIDGKLSAQYEHTILVKHGGYEILTLDK